MKNIKNALAAKAMAEVILDGMSMCDFRLEQLTADRAVDALNEIQLAMYKENQPDNQKITAIKSILDKYIAAD